MYNSEVTNDADADESVQELYMYFVADEEATR